MSDANRPTTRWPSSSVCTPSLTLSASSRRKLCRSSGPTQQNPTQGSIKTRHDIEELFKLYCTNSIKVNTFQQQMITGTRIPSGQIPSLSMINSSTDVFQSKHCVSPEQISSLDITCVEQSMPLNQSKPLPIKRTVQVRIDHNPAIPPSTTPPLLLCDTTDVLSTNRPPDELNDSSFVQSTACLEDVSIDYIEPNPPKQPRSTIMNLPPVPLQRKDPFSVSHSSFSTMHSVPSHTVTGRAVVVRERSSIKPAWHRQRTRTTALIPAHISPPNTNIKTSPRSTQTEPSTFPLFLGAQRVVSIPSRCSRYVLVTIPSIPMRYNAPTHVERLLLPTRFPTLFQNILHNRNTK